MSTRTTRPRGLAPWHPQPKTRELLNWVKAVLSEYEQYQPLTIRQIFYRLVGAFDFPKNEQAYKQLAEHINRARRAGLIDFHVIRDDGTTFAAPLAWESATELVQSFIGAAKSFRLDRQLGQPVRLMFAVEAAGMLPQVRRIADPYGIAVHSSGGFDSLTAKYDLAKMLGCWPKVEVLHLGDHDPSGVHVFSSMAEDVRRLVADSGLPGNIKFTRLAVIPVQITQFGLPTAPPKPTDRRSFSGETVQCEAISPDILADIIRSAVESRVDANFYGSVLEREQVIQEELTHRLRPLLRDFGGMP